LNHEQELQSNILNDENIRLQEQGSLYFN